MIYNSEIYMIECTHPEHDTLRYIGLDTKCDPNYLSSSVVVKWWINRLGRKYFKKTILETISGTMAECCRLEQSYILEHNAVASSEYMNMSGEKQKSSVEDMPISLDFDIVPSTHSAKQFINEVLPKVTERLSLSSHPKIMLVQGILSMIAYGDLKYSQLDFEYSKFRNYGACTPEDVQEVLSAMASEGYVDFNFNTITIDESLQDILDEYFLLDAKDFKINQIY